MTEMRISGCFLLQRKRSFSHSSTSDDSCKKRGRPRGSIIKQKLLNKAPGEADEQSLFVTLN